MPKGTAKSHIFGSKMATWASQVRLIIWFKAQARIPPGQRKIWPKGGVVLLFPCSSFRCFCYFGVLLVRCLVVLSFRRSSFRCFCRFVVRRVILVSFAGILGPTGSHRRANGSFWMPFWTKGDARQDGKQSNKSKKWEKQKTGKTCRGLALPGPGGRKVGPQWQAHGPNGSMKQVFFEAHPKKHEKTEKQKKGPRKNEKLKNMCFLRHDTFFTKKRRAQPLGDYWCFIENKR